MTSQYEITDRYTEAGDASELLYAPTTKSLVFQKSRRYLFDYEGEESAVRDFVKQTLKDPISQILHEGDAPALMGYGFGIDYGMKPGALDLEKEAVVSFYRGLKKPGFELNSLTIRQRVYVFGETEEEGTSDLFIRDICNGAIHNWEVIAG